MKNKVNFLNQSKKAFFYRRQFQQILNLVQESENLDYLLTLDLTFVEANYMQKMCKTYKNKDYIADVLSFPDFLVNKQNGKKLAFIGEILMCPETIYYQAQSYQHTNKREFCYMFTHSVFHLLNYDHIDEQEAKIMHEKVEKIMQKMEIYR
ncbi:putative metalloprotease mhp224 [Mesomycoplasma conjunctivae]|uniref:Endoribonuclease YbeY n=1 Tax=Mesomycoplasma conjunctivae (strain ATCC 25834 / NCTC 10147 / HRC/581) TaxID=572263 RepID=C5J677_MESCH|nr:rRNA maturation RNase YbeY [Mesomycoplasma conjunctivae]CAT04969.1 Putative metalloprotease mhp224 [Mesomycoplasma conjunctivae]VEU66137.1 putative metalloprotease mhp224 [Mesomycoplasma conjunctivae]